MKFLNEFLDEIEIDEEAASEIIKEASKYFVHIAIFDESTDFNDNYSSSYFRNHKIDLKDIVVKDNKFYGARVTVTGDYSERKTVVVPLHQDNVLISFGSEYSSIDAFASIAKLDDIKILNLRDHPELIVRASSVFQGYFGIPKDVYFESMRDSLLTSTYPLWFIAYYQDKYIIGGLGIIENDFHSKKELFPNICAVYVSDGYRGIRISELLINEAIESMHKVGIDTLYVVTDHIGFYEKYGFKYHSQTMCEDGESRVYIHEYKK